MTPQEIAMEILQREPAPSTIEGISERLFHAIETAIRAAVEQQRQKDAEIARRHAEKCNEAAEKIPRDYAGHLAEKHKAREATAIADAIEAQS